jgi:FkbM family methyltransferase
MEGGLLSKYFLRLLTANLLPTPILTWVKKHYYAGDVEKFWEDDVVPVKALVKPGDFVIDMGANFGWYTNVLSTAVGPSGKVYSIEPIPDTFQVLSGVIQKLGLANAIPLNYAMSSDDGTAMMRVPHHEYGGNNFYRAQIDSQESTVPNSQRVYRVPMRSLDSEFLNVATKITFIKCDVEGHELAVVKGAARFFERSKPAWLMEVGGNPDEEGSAPSQLFNIMRKHGYEIFFFDGKNLRRRPIGHWSVNYLMLQQGHRDSLHHLMAKE